MAELRRLVRIFFLMAKMVILPDLLNFLAALFFILGKIVRFLFFFAFVFSVVKGAGNVAGYSYQEVVLFFLVFNLVDIVTQFLFRGTYHFRNLIVSGNYDLDLLKPLPSFFRPLFGHVDIFDLITLLPLTLFFLYFVIKHQLISGFTGGLIFILLFFSSIILAFAFHLLVCSFCILTTTIDHFIWIYRDLTAMARFPTDIYRGLIRFLLTFVFPVVLLITFPAKGLLGLLSLEKVAFALVLSLFFAYLSLKFWFWSLRHYASASS